MSSKVNTHSRLVIFIAACMLLGGVDASKANQKSLSFEVKPKSCLIKSEGEPCLETITFVWQLVENIPICVRTEFNRILFCHDDNLQQQISIEFEVTSSTQFELVNSLTDEILARTQLMVVREIQEKTPAHYRHPWSIF